MTERSSSHGAIVAAWHCHTKLRVFSFFHIIIKIHWIVYRCVALQWVFIMYLNFKYRDPCIEASSNATSGSAIRLLIHFFSREAWISPYLPHKTERWFRNWTIQNIYVLYVCDQRLCPISVLMLSSSEMFGADFKIEDKWKLDLFHFKLMQNDWKLSKSLACTVLSLGPLTNDRNIQQFNEIFDANSNDTFVVIYWFQTMTRWISTAFHLFCLCCVASLCAMFA